MTRWQEHHSKKKLELECCIVCIINIQKFSFHWHIRMKQLLVKISGQHHCRRLNFATFISNSNCIVVKSNKFTSIVNSQVIVLQVNSSLKSFFPHVKSSHKLFFPQAKLKEHVALDRTRWSMKSVCNRFLINCIWLERCFKSRLQWPTRVCLEIAWFSCYCAN